jgi:cbb3-type cytochrome oxidase subunit 1
MTVVGVAGIVVIAAVISIASAAWQYRLQSQTQPASASWLYRFSLIALLVGLAISVTMAFRLIPEYYAHARILHLHVTLMGFIVMAMIGATQQFLPVILNTTLYSPRLARFVLVSLPAGFILLIGGFITSNSRSEGCSSLPSGSIPTTYSVRGWIQAIPEMPPQTTSWQRRFFWFS